MQRNAPAHRAGVRGLGCGHSGGACSVLPWHGATARECPFARTAACFHPISMRQSIKDLAAAVAQTLPLSAPIYEFGAMQVEGQEGFADLRPFFPGKTYVGCDMRAGLGVDRVLDLHRIDVPSGSVGSVISLDTLEHVEYPHTALTEIHRILAPNGIALITSVMDFPIHDYPHDYWRFTPEAFRSLLKPFQSCFVGHAGRDLFPHTVVGLGFKGEAPDLRAFQQRFEAWRSAQLPPKASVGDLLKLLVPPIFSRRERRRVCGAR